MLEIKFKNNEKEVWLNSQLKKKATKKKRRKKIKRKKKPGPKRSGTDRYVRFQETAVGHFLYVYAPVQYNLLMLYGETANTRRKIDYHSIEAIALNSKNPAFKSVRFRKAMIIYRQSGLHPLRKTTWTLADAVYFARHSYRIHEAIKNASGY